MAPWKRAGNIGARLKDLREAMGMLQEEFGDLMGVTDQTVSDYENARSEPAKSRLERLARKVGIAVAAFSEGGPMPSTLPRSPVQPRSPARGPGPRVEATRQKLLALADEYRDRGQMPSREVWIGWMKMLEDVIRSDDS